MVFESSVTADSGGYAKLCVLQNGMRQGGERSRSRAPAPMAPAWPASSPIRASRCSRSAACGGSAARAGRPMPSTPSGPLGAFLNRNVLQRRAAAETQGATGVIAAREEL